VKETFESKAAELCGETNAKLGEWCVSDFIFTLSKLAIDKAG
jgi:hypothetical protein